jgi:hypothetical protein
VIDAILVHSINQTEPDLYGFLWIDHYSEGLDNHCEQCMNEQPLFFGSGKSDDFPAHLAAGIGPTKYAKIVSGDIDMKEQCSVEIVCSLLNGEEIVALLLGKE